MRTIEEEKQEELKSDQENFIKGMQESLSVLESLIADQEYNLRYTHNTIDRLSAEISIESLKTAAGKIKDRIAECELRFRDANNADCEGSPDSLIYKAGAKVTVLPGPDALKGNDVPRTGELTGRFRHFFGEPYVEVRDDETAKLSWVPDSRISYENNVENGENN